MADWRVGAQILGDHWSQGQKKWWTKPALPFSIFTSCVALCKKVLRPERTCWCQTVFLHLTINNNYWPQTSAPAADIAFLLPGWACCCCKFLPLTGTGGSLIWPLNWVPENIFSNFCLPQFYIISLCWGQSLTCGVSKIIWFQLLMFLWSLWSILKTLNDKRCLSIRIF